MKPVVFACLAAVAVAAPQFQGVFPTAQIVSNEHQQDASGNFNYAYETDNGISVESSGTQGSQGQSNMEGVYRFPLPDGSIAEVRYVADEFGFRPQSALLPSSVPFFPPANEQRFVQQQPTNQNAFVFQ